MEELEQGTIFRLENGNTPHKVLSYSHGNVYQVMNLVTGSSFPLSFDGLGYVLLEPLDTEEDESTEDIHNPERYTQNNIECWDFIAKYNLDYFVGCAIKYVWRHKHKNGRHDLEKALEYLEKKIKLNKFYNREDNFQYYPPDIIDYQDMDMSQMVILYYASKLQKALPEAQKELVERLYGLVEEYKDEYY